MPALTHRSVCRRALSARVHAAACIVLACLGAPAAAQPDPVTVSGFQHVALGDIAELIVAGRTVRACCLGSSGEDGVGIQCLTTGGVGCDIDLTPFMQTQGAVCRVAYRGWDGTIKGRIDMSHLGCCDDREVDGLVDFTTLSATGVRFVMRDLIGGVLAEGEVPGALCAFHASGPSPTPGNPIVWRMRTRLNELEATLKNLGIIARCMSSNVTITGLTPGPIEHVSSIEFFPIICITSPCPGQWGNISAMEITASGLPGGMLEVSNAHRTLSVRPINDPPTVESQQLLCWGVGQAAVDEGCDLPPPVACAPFDRSLSVANIGSSGQDGVSFDLTSTVSLHTDGIVHRDIAARSFEAVISTVGGGGGGAGGIVGIEARRGCCNGHVTILKLTETHSGATGETFIRCDPSGRGATQCTVRCFSAAGTLLGTAVIGAADSVVAQIPPGAERTLGFTPFGAHRAGMGGATCIIPGAVVQGVDRVVFSPSKPIDSTSPIGQVDITGQDLGLLTIESVSYEESMFVSGIDHSPIGAASLTQLNDRELLVSNIGSSGQDGVEIHLDSLGGGACIDLLPLLGVSPEVRQIRATVRGWDYTNKGRITITSNPGGTLTETHDFSILGAPSVQWVLRGESGNLLAQGTSAGPILTWELDPGTAAAPLEKCFWSSGAADQARSARQGFFDRVVTVSGVTPVPVSGVVFVEITPDPCAGLPENCPPEWTSTASIVFTASNIPSFTVTDAAVRASLSLDDVEGHSCSGLGKAVLQDLDVGHQSRALHVSNIGSSGQDGVSISLFDTARPPAGAECSLDIAPSWLFGGGGSFSLDFRGRACPACSPGHVTVLKISVSPDPNSPGATELYRFDATELGAAACTASLRSSTGVELASVVLSPTDPLSIPATLSGRRFSRREAFMIELGLPTDIVLASGTTVVGVVEVRLTPIDATSPGDFPVVCRVRGQNLHGIVFNRIFTAVNACPADFDGNGTREVTDIFVFLTAWFGGDPTAYEFGGTPGVPAIFAFLTAWFTACP